MPSTTSRREFFAAATAASSLVLRAADGDKPAKLEGIFPIMQTPFTDSGAVDYGTLAREVAFLQNIGAQGMTWPQLASEWASLTVEERITGAETIATAAGIGEKKVVIGVQANDIETAVKLAKHAEKIKAGAIIAIPLDGGKDDAKQMEYYSAIGAATRLPLIVQAIGPMSVDLILAMAQKIPTLRYVKDEAGVTLSRLNEYRKHGQILDGVFTGKHGPTFLDDLARGAIGNMPAAGFADLYVAPWKAWKAGKKDQAMDLFAHTLLFISAAQAYGLEGQKYILQLRGVFANTHCRGGVGANAVFDEDAREAIRRIVTHAKPWFKPFA